MASSDITRNDATINPTVDDFKKNNSAYRAMFDRCYSKAGLSIDTNTNDVETDNAIDYSIGGIMYTKAAQTAIDISGLTFIDENGDTSAVTAQGDDIDRIYLFVINAAGTIKVVQGVDAAIGETTYCPGLPAGYCAFGAVKVSNATGSDFTFGTTGLDTANVTDTYYDLSFPPATLD